MLTEANENVPVKKDVIKPVYFNDNVLKFLNETLSLPEDTPSMVNIKPYFTTKDMAESIDGRYRNHLMYINDVNNNSAKTYPAPVICKAMEDALITFADPVIFEHISPLVLADKYIGIVNMNANVLIHTELLNFVLPYTTITEGELFSEVETGLDSTKVSTYFELFANGKIKPHEMAETLTLMAMVSFTGNLEKIVDTIMRSGKFDYKRMLIESEAISSNDSFSDGYLYSAAYSMLTSICNGISKHFFDVAWMNAIEEIKAATAHLIAIKSV